MDLELLSNGPFHPLNQVNVGSLKQKPHSLNSSSLQPSGSREDPSSADTSPIKLSTSEGWEKKSLLLDLQASFQPAQDFAIRSLQ